MLKHAVRKSRKKCISIGMGLILAELLVIYLCIIGNSVLEQNKKSQRMLLSQWDDIMEGFDRDRIKDATKLYPSRIQREIREFNEHERLQLQECGELFQLLSNNESIQHKIKKFSINDSDLIRTLKLALEEASQSESVKDKELFGEISGILKQLSINNADEALVPELMLCMDKLHEKGFLTEDQMSSLLDQITTKYFMIERFQDVSPSPEVVHQHALTALATVGDLRDDLKKLGDRLGPLFDELSQGFIKDETFLHAAQFSVEDIKMPQEDAMAMVEAYKKEFNEAAAKLTDQEKETCKKLAQLFEEFSPDNIHEVARLTVAAEHTLPPIFAGLLHFPEVGDNLIQRE